MEKRGTQIDHLTATLGHFVVIYCIYVEMIFIVRLEREQRTGEEPTCECHNDDK